MVDQATPFFAERYKLLDVHLDKEVWQLTVPLDEPVQVGSTIYCEFDPDGIMFFDTKSGRRVG